MATLETGTLQGYGQKVRFKAGKIVILDIKKHQDSVVV